MGTSWMLSLPEVWIVLTGSRGEHVRLTHLSSAAVGTATVMELELRGRIRCSEYGTGGNVLPAFARLPVLRLELLDTSRTREAALDEALAALRQSSQLDRITLAEVRRTIGGPGLVRKFVARLVDGGWFGDSGRRTLVRRRPKYQVNDPAAVELRKEELFEQLLGDHSLADRDRALAALLDASGGGLEGGPWAEFSHLLPNAGQGLDRHERRERLAKVAARAREEMRGNLIARTFCLELEAAARNTRALSD
jgi:Golgi phosphoprotein 3 (GPP34)